MSLTEVAAAAPGPNEQSATAVAAPSGEIDLRRVRRSLIQYAPMICVVAVLCGLGLYFNAKNAPKRFESVATIQISEIPGAGLKEDARLELAGELELATQELVLGSPELSAAVRTKLGIGETADYSVVAEQIQGTAAIDVRAEAGSPELAQALVTEIIDQYSSARGAATQRALETDLASAQSLGVDQQLLVDRYVRELQTLRDSVSEDEQEPRAQIDTIDLLRKEATGRLIELERREQVIEARLANLEVGVDIISLPSFNSFTTNSGPSRAGLLGIILGGVVATLVTLVGSTIRDRVLVAGDVSTIAPNAPLLARVQRGRTHAGFANRSREAFRFVSSAVGGQLADQRPAAIAVVAADHGPGRAWASVHLASALATDGLDVALADFDVYQSRASTLLNVTPEHTTADVLIGDAKAEDSLAEVVLEGGRLRVLGSRPLPKGERSPVSSERAHNVVVDLVANNEFVIIDTPPILTVSDGATTAGVVDWTVLVVTVGLTRRRDVREALELLHQRNVSLLGVVLVSRSITRKTRARK